MSLCSLRFIQSMVHLRPTPTHTRSSEHVLSTILRTDARTSTRHVLPYVRVCVLVKFQNGNAS